MAVIFRIAEAAAVKKMSHAGSGKQFFEKFADAGLLFLRNIFFVLTSLATHPKRGVFAQALIDFLFRALEPRKAN